MPLSDELNGYLRLSRAFFGIKPPETGDPDVGVLGIPYDITSSHTPGSRFGPDEIRKSMDSERSHSFPLTIGVSPLIKETPLSKLISIEDIGDLEISTRPPESAFYDISDACSKLANHESKLLFLGGDHFITYPIMKGLTRAAPGIWGVIYLDAHADMYESYDGQQYSHATTLFRIIDSQLVKSENVVLFDLRAALPSHRERLDYPEDMSIDTIIQRIGSMCDIVDHVHISVDIDVLDPSIAPSVAHPESAGLDLAQVVSIMRPAFKTKKVRSADIVEFNPLLEGTRITSITVRDIVKEVLTGFAYSII